MCSSDLSVPPSTNSPPRHRCCRRRHSSSHHPEDRRAHVATAERPLPSTSALARHSQCLAAECHPRVPRSRHAAPDPPRSPCPALPCSFSLPLPSPTCPPSRRLGPRAPPAAPSRFWRPARPTPPHTAAPHPRTRPSALPTLPRPPRSQPPPPPPPPPRRVGAPKVAAAAHARARSHAPSRPATAGRQEGAELASELGASSALLAHGAGTPRSLPLTPILPCSLRLSCSGVPYASTAPPSPVRGVSPLARSNAPPGPCLTAAGAPDGVPLTLELSPRSWEGPRGGGA